MNGPLAQLLRYNAWANERIVDACRPLGDEQLDAIVFSGPGRSIRETLFHIATGQFDFLARLEGHPQDAGRAREWESSAITEALARDGSLALVEAAEALTDDVDVVVPYAGRRPVFPKSFFLAHAFAHGAQHRTEIVLMLEQLGLPAPNLDGWEYAAAAGLGMEAG